MWHRLLLAIDRFDSGQAALDFTIGLARGSGADVRVLHARELSRFSRIPPVESVSDAQLLVDDAVLALRLADIGAEGRTCSAIEERVATRIVAEAARWECDALVLGSRRLRWVGRLSGRGIRERVVRLSPLPVIVAPTPLPGRRRRLFVPTSADDHLEGTRPRRQ
jgi:nucleotide-binding universal stress UspA family protein